MWILLERIAIALGVVVLGDQALQLFKGRKIDANRLYKKIEAARILDIAESEVDLLIKNGQIRAKVVGDVEYITGNELDRFLA